MTYSADSVLVTAVGLLLLATLLAHVQLAFCWDLKISFSRVVANIIVFEKGRRIVQMHSFST